VTTIDLAERGWLPDPLIRFGIRGLNRRRLKKEYLGQEATTQRIFTQRIEQLRNSPIAIETQAANEQHYEVPAAFFEHCLGSRLKYSCGYWPSADTSLDQSEREMLQLSCQRADLQDGQDILELGCGWGSLTLWMAEKYPNSRITAVSNSQSQRHHITAQAAHRGLINIEVQTADANHYTTEQRFDRVVSVEMFEHMRNYQRLMENIGQWLRPTGKLFVHIFCHREVMYPFEVQGNDDWMSKYFFTGGLMPAFDTLAHFQDHLTLAQRWSVSGVHYQRTANAWLQKMDSNKTSIMPVLRDAYGDHAEIWWQRWRIFYMACAELFGHRNGTVSVKRNSGNTPSARPECLLRIS